MAVTIRVIPILKSLRGVLVPALLLVAWEINAHRDAAHAYAFVPLEHVWSALVALVGNGDLWVNLRGSLVRTSLGLALGITLGVCTGSLLAFSKIALTLINPLYQGIRQVPIVGLTPLIALWFGNGEPAKLLMITLAAFYPMVLNTYEGLRQVDERYREVGRVYGFGRWLLLRRVLLPGALPSLLIGILQAVPFAWFACVGAELLFNAGPGLSNLMMTAQLGAHMDVIVVCVLTITVTGVAMNRLMELLTARALRWRG